MEAPQKSDWLMRYMDHLRALIKEPPYLAFFFVAAVLLIIGAFQPQFFYVFLAIFLYSVVGVVWRHAVKDIRGRLKALFKDQVSKINLYLTLAYQLINLTAVFLLIFVIVRYCI